jgi:hypothetical protein
MSKSVGVGLGIVVGMAVGVMLSTVNGRGADATAQPSAGGVPPLEVGKHYRFAGPGGHQDATVRELPRGNWVKVEPDDTKSPAWVNLALMGFVLELPQGGSVESVQAKVKTLTLAAQAYEIQFGVRPNSLQSLQSPPNGRPFIDAKKEYLIDAWGRPYKYDAAGPNNRGLKPDVWSEGPDPNDKTKIIGNWPNG